MSEPLKFVQKLLSKNKALIISFALIGAAWAAKPSIMEALSALTSSSQYVALEAFANTYSAKLVCFGVLLSAFSVLYLYARLINKVSIVDPYWSLGFLLSAIVYYIHRDSQNGNQWRKDTTMLLTSLWAIRLAAYLFWRNWGHEDYRYAQFAKHYGKNWWWVSYFQTFVLQGVLNWIIGHPLSGAISGDAPASVLDFVGMAVWAVGFYFEAVGDFQLAAFKSSPKNKGKLLTTGLWKYTRHPNYFGNAAMFWGFYLLSAGAGNYSTIYSPILMTFLLLKVSGVALLERGLRKTKPGFEAYMRNTSSFFPWFPTS